MRASPAKAKKLGRRWKLSAVPADGVGQPQDSCHEGSAAGARSTITRRSSWRSSVPATSELVEKNNWHDNFWGDCTCLRCYRIGENHLGKLWMELRDEISATEPE